MTLPMILLLDVACSAEMYGMKTARETKFMAHGRHVACKTIVEAKKEASTWSEDSAERAVRRQGLSGAGWLATGIDGGLSVSKGKCQPR